MEEAIDEYQNLGLTTPEEKVHQKIEYSMIQPQPAPPKKDRMRIPEEKMKEIADSLKEAPGDYELAKDIRIRLN